MTPLNKYLGGDDCHLLGMCWLIFRMVASYQGKSKEWNAAIIKANLSEMHLVSYNSIQ